MIGAVHGHTELLLLVEINNVFVIGVREHLYLMCYICMLSCWEGGEQGHTTIEVHGEPHKAEWQADLEKRGQAVASEPM